MKDLYWLSNFVGKANWIILIFLGAISLPLTDTIFFGGVMSGGIIAGANFYLLNRTIQKNLNPGQIAEKSRFLLWGMLVRYYIRFFVSAVLIFILISNHWVNPLGLLTGISVVVCSVFLGTIVLVAESLFKEAV